MGRAISNYLDAAQNKIRVARRHFELLMLMREGSEAEQTDVQIHFEGLIGAGSSAGDQISEAVARLLGVKIRTNSPGKLLNRIDQLAISDELARCLVSLRTWVETPIVQDAHKRRRLAVHHHYVKAPNRLLGSWMLEEEEIDGAPSPYAGPLDIHSYGAVYMQALEELERCVTCLLRTSDTEHPD